MGDVPSSVGAVVVVPASVGIALTSDTMGEARSMAVGMGTLPAYVLCRILIARAYDANSLLNNLQYFQPFSIPLWYHACTNITKVKVPMNDIFASKN